MKRVLFAVSVVCAMISAQASVMYWQVSDTEFNGHEITDYNVYAFQSGGTGAITFDDIRNGDASGTLVDFAEPGMEMYDVDVTAFAGTAGGESYSFYIELIGYTTSDKTETGVIGTSEEAISYADLVAANSIKSSLSDVTSIAPWVGGGYAVPEPTSGLLMMMGLALLSLKRRKE